MQRTHKKSNAFVRVEMEKRRKTGWRVEPIQSDSQRTNVTHARINFYGIKQKKSIWPRHSNLLPIETWIRKKVSARATQYKSQEIDKYTSNQFFVVVVASVIYSAINYNFCFIVAQCYGLIRFQALIQWHGKSVCAQWIPTEAHNRNVIPWHYNANLCGAWCQWKHTFSNRK